MSLRRAGILLRKELFQGSKSFLFVYVLVAPIVISLVISLVFGTFFSEKARLGIVDEGDSELVALALEVDSITTREYSSVSEVMGAVQGGSVDVGIVLSAGFDDSVVKGEEIEVSAYVWGESLAKNRTILYATVADLARDLAGQEVPVDIEAVALGEEAGVPWEDRLLPFIVLMAVILSGAVVPASSLVEEKQKNTLEAVVVTPTSLGDVFLAKGILGIVLSLAMGILILVINQAFAIQPALLIMVLILGAVMAAEFGLLLGALVKDITTLFAMLKFIGILLYAPGFVYLFPQIPEWVGRIFPTYYVVQPIVDLSLGGGGWPDIATNVFILIGLDVLLVGVLALTLRRVRQYAF